MIFKPLYFQLKLSIFSLSKNLLNKKSDFFGHFLEKKSAFLVLPDIKNGFSDSFPFQTVYFYSHHSNSLKVRPIQYSRFPKFLDHDTSLREINSQGIIQTMKEEEKEEKKKKRGKRRREEKDLVIQGRAEFCQLGFGPSWFWADLVLGRVGFGPTWFGPSWFWAELTREREIEKTLKNWCERVTTFCYFYPY